MANFNIQRARGTLPGRAAQVRANVDVRTGGRQVAGAVAGLGGAMADLGLKWDLMEASTQLNEAKMKAKQEHIRLMLALPGIEPEGHTKAYEKSLKTQQGFIPKNKRAAASYNQFINNFNPQWWLNVENATKAKLKDNKRAIGFEMQQEAIASGNNKDYFAHLEEGKILGVYSAETVVKYKQATIDGHIMYVKRLEAEAKRQKEIEFATHNPSVYWKLLRKVTADPKSVDEPELAAAVGPDSITTDDYKELNRIRESKDTPLKTPRAQLYFNSLDALYEDRDTDDEERMKWDVSNEKLVQFFNTNPNVTAKQAAEFYDDLISEDVEGILNRAFNLWLQSPFGILGRKALGVEKEGKKSPYSEYPDAFLENGVWKVMKDGRKYRIE